MDGTKNALRIKVTGKCNRSCCFCHEEGDLAGIEDIALTNSLFEAVQLLRRELGIGVIALTGGEPLVYSELEGLIDALAGSADPPRFSMTTNGTVRKGETFWSSLAASGLYKVNVSISELLTETCQSDYSGYLIAGGSRDEATMFESQVETIEILNGLGVAVDVNVVVYNDFAHTFTVMKRLMALQEKGLRFRTMMLPDLTSNATIERSFDVLRRIRDAGDLCLVERVARQGSSGSVAEYGRSGRSVFFKSTMSDGGTVLDGRHVPVFVEEICGGCSVRERGECQEGFYGLRLEQRKGALWVRLCLHRRADHQRKVLQPLDRFIASSEFTELKRLWA